VLNKEQTFSASGIPLKEIYTPEDVKSVDYDRDIGLPGQPPYTRGVYPTMYRGKLWTIRRLSGFNTPEETNQLYKEEYELGQTGFSVAPDISTVVGMDADDPRISADIGHAGVPMSTLEDVETTFEGLPIEKVSTYLADRCGAVTTAMYFVMAEKRGIDLKELRGTTANDMLASFVPSLVNQPGPEAYLRYAVDFIEYCAEYVPKWNPVSFDSYNARDCGLSAVQEMGMLFATAIQYEDPRCALFRVHVQSAGSTHTTQEPLNNVIRIAFQVLAGALGGAQSIHANGYDEGICLPTDQSMLISIRTEQIAALESNVTNTIDPLGGSYYVESLTNELEERAWEYVRKIEDMGGMMQAVASGWVHKEYREATIEHERRLESGEASIIGVNKFRLEKEPHEVPILEWDPQAPYTRIEKLKRFKKQRDQAKVARALEDLEEVTRRGENVFPAVMEAVRGKATLGEIAGMQTKVYGVWRYPIGL